MRLPARPALRARPGLLKCHFDSYRTQQLPFYEWNDDVSAGPPGQQQGIWQQCEPHSGSTVTDSAVGVNAESLPSSFSISSLNRWFDARDEHLRTAALIQILKDSTADVFCLQEMTAACLSRLKSDPHVQKKWIITNRDGTFGVSYGSATWYGQITLVKKSTARVIDVRDVYLSFHGKELRPLHVVDIELKDSLATGGIGTRIQIINVHLQSLEGEGIERQEQIRLAASLATHASPKLTFLAGDTNFYTARGMEVPETLGFRDTWKQLRGGEPGHTFGFTYPSNTSTALSRRIDGIFFWPDPAVIPDSIELFGGDAIQGHPLVFLSDHVGLTATFHLYSALGNLGGNVRQ